MDSEATGTMDVIYDAHSNAEIVYTAASQKFSSDGTPGHNAIDFTRMPFVNNEAFCEGSACKRLHFDRWGKVLSTRAISFYDIEVVMVYNPDRGSGSSSGTSNAGGGGGARRGGKRRLM